MGKGYLVLETGEVFEGELLGKVGSGEVIFNTSMTGYQDVVRDPGFSGQVVVFSYPVVRVDAWEEYQGDIQVSGVVVSELMEKEDGWVRRMGDIPLLMGVDTRALVKCIGKYGSVRGTISEGLEFQVSDGVGFVGKREIVEFGGSGPHAVLVDYGYNRETLEILREQCRVTAVPHDFGIEEIRMLKPDLVVLSDGSRLEGFASEIMEEYPVLGIGLGHQVLTMASGAKVVGIKRRINNYAVRDVGSGRVSLVTGKRKFVLEGIEKEWDVRYINVNDGTVEGLTHKSLIVETIQFGLTEEILKRFLKVGDVKYAVA